MSTKTTMTCLPPDSEMVPSSHAKCTSILRVAHHFHISHPRIAYLCVHGAPEESKKIDPLSLTRGVRQFRFSLERWIEKNDETSEQGRFQPNTDVPDLQSFCLDYYQKTIVAMIKITSKRN
ncbi:PREDICTED: callose synthase 1-like [Camelina sativa]|uniref:Callose synthase 1-like n=1 Tax=Camelina sativa TaxID=90675 RepID=A0ABM0WE89_CAMSA|nr:PREDICTED: callose synthase 1-like [Camelina sativa]